MASLVRSFAPVAQLRPEAASSRVVGFPHSFAGVPVIQRQRVQSSGSRVAAVDVSARAGGRGGRGRGGDSGAPREVSRSASGGRDVYRMTAFLLFAMLIRLLGISSGEYLA